MVCQKRKTGWLIIIIIVKSPEPQLQLKTQTQAHEYIEKDENTNNTHHGRRTHSNFTEHHILEKRPASEWSKFWQPWYFRLHAPKSKCHDVVNFRTKVLYTVNKSTWVKKIKKKLVSSHMKSTSLIVRRVSVDVKQHWTRTVCIYIHGNIPGPLGTAVKENGVGLADSNQTERIYVAEFCPAGEPCCR